MSLAFHNTLTFNPDIINYRIFSFLKFYNAISLKSKKTLFSPFFDTKPFFAMKKANHDDKQPTPSES